MIEYGFDQTGCKMAKGQFMHWLSGKGTPLPVPVDRLKDTDVYRNLMASLARKCQAMKKGERLAGSAVVFGSLNSLRERELNIVMGRFNYDYIMVSNGDGCCKVDFTVEDDMVPVADVGANFDFTYKMKTLDFMKSMGFPGEVSAQVKVNISDAVFSQMGVYYGAKKFAHGNAWSDSIQCIECKY